MKPCSLTIPRPQNITGKSNTLYDFGYTNKQLMELVFLSPILSWFKERIQEMELCRQRIFDFVAHNQCHTLLFVQETVNRIFDELQTHRRLYDILNLGGWKIYNNAVIIASRQFPDGQTIWFPLGDDIDRFVTYGLWTEEIEYWQKETCHRYPCRQNLSLSVQTVTNTDPLPHAMALATRYILTGDVP